VKSIDQNSAVIDEDWYLHIIPRFMEQAGFELSTGIMVNSVEAKEAARKLKEIKS
jgi:galactose-1-phosphate uridylyltransferase